MMHIPLDKRVLRLVPLLCLIGLALIFMSGIWILPVGILLSIHCAFFRDPLRKIPPGNDPVAPADGTIVEILHTHDDVFFQEEVTKIGIFLSVLNVHVNRSPMKGRVEMIKYVPGEFVNALRNSSSQKNESNLILLANESKKILVKQISGAIARRICCDVSEGQIMERGEKLGIICYGSRTEFWVLRREFKPAVQLGQHVKAGETILGQWNT